MNGTDVFLMLWCCDAAEKLTPYVTLKMKPLRGRYKPGQHPMSGDCFLEQWKEVNGVN